MRQRTPEEKKAHKERLALVKGTDVKPKKRKEPVPSVALLDRLFSQYIRRYQSCQLHGFGGIRCSNSFDCSHIKSRRFHSIRWDARNAICACDSHHRWQHDHPEQSGLALLEILGREHLDELHGVYLSGKKPTPQEKRAILKWLRDELKNA